jgi:uncharacterized membrane protein HdeD (DUF308 family)
MNSLGRNWWASVVRGLVFILFGILVLAWPREGLVALLTLFACYALIDGAFAFAAAAARPHEQEQRITFVLEGVTSVAAGVLTFVWPGLTAIALLYLIAVRAVINGVLEVIAAVRLHRGIEHEWMLGLAGVLSVLFGFLVLSRPGLGALAVLGYIGLYAILVGLALVAVGFRLRLWWKRPASA